MAQGDTTIVLDKLFTKGVVRNLGENKTADHYAEVMINLRIKNGGITARKGTKTIYTENNTTPTQGIVGNSNNNTLLVVHDSELKKIDLSSDPVTSTTIGSIGYSGKVRFVNYGKYTIILTGSGYPWVYDNNTLSQLTSTNITANANPSFGAKYAGFTIVNSNLESNIIHISRPITTATQIYSYDRAGSGSEKLPFDSKVLAMISTLQFLWVFTSETIEYIGRDNLATTGGIASLFSIPIAGGDQIMNSDCVASANEFIFYRTAGKRRKTINYIQGNPNPQVAVISEEIDELMQSILHDDQSKSFMYYDKQENLVKLHARTKGSTVNDIVIIRNMEEKTFFFDYDKYYVGVTELNSIYYACNSYIYRIIQDEIGTDDDDSEVNWRFETSKLTAGNPVVSKQRRGNKIAGRLNLNTTINREFEVSQKSIMKKQITSTISGNGGYLGVGIGGSPIGLQPIGGELYEEVEELSPFEREANHGAIREDGNYARIILYGGNKGQKFVIDYADITLKVRKRVDRSIVV